MIRSLVGVGEAAYGTISPPMLSDFYPFRERNVVYGIYYLAIPVGAALGYAIGAILGNTSRLQVILNIRQSYLGGAFGWRVAFVVCGIPGIFVAVMILRLNDPVRGINDKVPIEGIGEKDIMFSETEGGSRALSVTHLSTNGQLLDGKHLSSNQSDESRQSDLKPDWKEELRVMTKELYEICSNSHFMFATGGLVASNFALGMKSSFLLCFVTMTQSHTKFPLSVGGLADWFATFLLRYDNFTLDAAGLVVGAATVVGGIGGSVLGSKVNWMINW